MMQDTGSNGTANYGNALLKAQNNALDQAQKRQQLQAGQLALQRKMMLLAAAMNPGAQGSGLPIDATGAQQPQQPLTPAQQQQQQQAQQQLLARQRQIASGAAPAPVAGASPASAPSPQGASPGGLPGFGRPGPSAPQPVVPALIRAQMQARGGMPSAMPGAGASPGGMPAAMPGWLTAPTAQQIAGIPVGGFNPQRLRALNMLNGSNPLTTAQQIRTQQLQIAQQRYAPSIARLDTLTKSDKPTQYVKADPQLSAAWQQLAPHFGYDPTKDFNDQNVRTAFTFARNKLAGALSEATAAPNVPLTTTPIGLGGSVQTNPLTGKITTGAPQQPTAQFVMPDGTVKMMTKAAGMSQGLTPFNSETYANPNTLGGMATLIANYKLAPLTGYSLRSAQGQAIMAQVQAINPNYDATQFATKNRARQAFASGTQGNTVRSLSVATDHLDQLAQAATALNNSNKPAWNSIANAWGTQMGHPEIRTFDAMKEVVGDEVVKAVVGASGAEGDREAIKEAFSAASSPQQIVSVVNHYKALMGGQLNGLRQQYVKSTGLTDFSDMLSPAARAELKSPAGAAGAGTPSVNSLNIGQSATLGGFTVTRVK
jgi:hypothetical protein